MNALRTITRPAFRTHPLRSLGLSLALLGMAQMSASAASAPQPTTVQVRLSEWAVTLDPKVVSPGAVVFRVVNDGSIPHAFEVEGQGLEKSISLLKPGQAGELTVDLRAGKYETYCPVGKDSHKMLGMINHLKVAAAKRSTGERQGAYSERAEHAEVQTERDEYPASAEAHGESHAEHGMSHAGGGEEQEYGTRPKVMTVVGGGPVIQILPGPFPFADSAAAVIQDRPADQQADLTKKSHLGPYSNNVATITGNISLTAIDRGATKDSVSGVASFTAGDGARWKVIMDRVQTKDIPFNPRFGGVIMGLFYHGASGVHTPLVPTIQSSLALWAFAHLYKNDQLVSDNAMVHIMLLSRTRRTKDWALDCWDCSDRPVEELQLQVTPAPNTAPFDSPGGFLFVNWEKSSGRSASL